MNQQQTEQLRWATLEYLACRSTCAFNAMQVQRGMIANGTAHMIGATIDEPSVRAALYFMSSEGFILTSHPPMSAIPVYQVTSKGVTAWERKRLEQEG
ncbi:MAG: hypothetical protein ACOYOU_01005 [Kiritimatiellia bacterium]